MLLPEGAVVDRYRIEAPLGRGGMGHVYRAIDLRLRRPIALKVLHEKISATAMARLVREARLAGSLNHPNIVGVYDVGEHEGLAFMAMELVDGKQLKQLVWRDLAIEQKVRWLADIARGLEAAHRAGVVHRDVKPQNVMVTTSAAKILDFGVAKEIEGRSLTALLPSMQTQPGFAVGTPYYMAPEILRGDRPSDDRADQFSWGLIAYELLVGKLPVRDDLERRGPWVAPRIVLPEVSERVSAVVHRTLSEYDARFSAMADVASALEASLSPLPRTVEQERKERRPHTVIDGGGAAQPTMLFPIVTPDSVRPSERAMPASQSPPAEIREPKLSVLQPLVSASLTELARALPGEFRQAVVIVTLDIEKQKARFFVQLVAVDDLGTLWTPDAPMDLVRAAATAIADDARDGNGRWQRLVLRLQRGSRDVSIVQVI